MPERGTQPGQQVAGRVREIFRAMAVDGEITVRYTTVLTLGRLQACKG